MTANINNLIILDYENNEVGLLHTKCRHYKAVNFVSYILGWVESEDLGLITENGPTGHEQLYLPTNSTEVNLITTAISPITD